MSSSCILLSSGFCFEKLQLWSLAIWPNEDLDDELTIGLLWKSTVCLVCVVEVIEVKALNAAVESHLGLDFGICMMTT